MLSLFQFFTETFPLWCEYFQYYSYSSSSSVSIVGHAGRSLQSALHKHLVYIPWPISFRQVLITTGSSATELVVLYYHLIHSHALLYRNVIVFIHLFVLVRINSLFLYFRSWFLGFECRGWRARVVEAHR